MKHVISILVLVAMVACLAFAGGSVAKKGTLANDGVAGVAPAHRVVSQSPMKTSAINWVLVDSAANEFGAASWTCNMVAYDAPTDRVTMGHRGHVAYAGGSGEIWYNISTDGGTSWTRVAGLNTSVTPLRGRYPTFDISNGTQSTDPANALYVFNAPSLDAGGANFGLDLFGGDFPLGGASPFAFLTGEANDFGTAQWIWASKHSAEVYMGDFSSVHAGYFMIRTADYVTIDSVVPTGWLEADMQTTPLGASGSYCGFGGASRGGADYFFLMAVFKGDTLATPDPNFSYQYNLGYAKTTDNGATWAPFVRPETGAAKDYRGLPGLGLNFVTAAGYTSGRPNAQGVVDANGLVHFFTVVADTNAGGTYSIVEIYETAANTWTTKWVKQGLNPHTIQEYVGLDQDSWDLRASTDAGGNVIALCWLDAATSAATDTMPDVWLTARKIGGDWMTPTDITNTPDFPELLLHMGRELKSNGSDNYTAYLGSVYTADQAHVGLPTSSVTSDYYVGAYSFTVTGTAVNDKPAKPYTYSIDQNYPNPFNPSSVINYSLATAGNVKLTVYNILGQEVASLVNGFQTAGAHSVTFDAKNLSSGVYLYTINAGNFSATKKMVLMK